MPLTVTTQGRIEVWRGTTRISTHNVETEAFEAAIRHAEANGAGQYQLRYPNKVVDVGSILITVSRDTTAPAVPAQPTVGTITQTSIAFSWPAVTDTGGSGLKGYDIELNGSIVLTDSPTSSYMATGLTAGQSATLRVRARDNAGNVSNFSTARTATTTANQAPNWLAAPAPSFTIGTAANYSLSSLCVDAEGDAITFSSVGTALPIGVTINNATKALEYTGAGSPGTTSGLRLRATAVGGSADSAVFSLTLTGNVGVSGNTTLTLSSGPSVAAVPFRTGVPMPLGTLFSASQIKLTDTTASTEVPVDAIPLGAWPDGSINSVLIVGKTDVAGSAKPFRLDYGPGVSRAAPSTAVVVTQGGGLTTVNTGVVTATIDANGMISSIVRGGTTVAAGGDAFMVRASDSVEFTASNANDCVITLEETGPVRACIKAFGTLRSAGGATYIKYLVRYYFVAGSDVVDTEFTVVDTRQEAVVNDPTTFAVSATSVGMRWTYTQDSTPAYRFGGDAAAVHSGNVTGEHYQFATGTYVQDSGALASRTFAYSGVASGQYAEGWMAIDTTARHQLVMLRDFWQRHPCELNVNGSMITAYFFSPRAVIGSPDLAVLPQGGTAWQFPNTFYFYREGGCKTWQLRTQYAAATPSSATAQAHNTYFQRHRLEMRPTAQWVCDSKVLGDIAPAVGAQNSNPSYHYFLKNDVYKQACYPYVTPTQVGPSTRGISSLYGWKYFGESGRPGWAAVINGTRMPTYFQGAHLGANKHFVEFVVTQDDEWWYRAETETLHGRDTNFSFAQRSGYWNTGGNVQPPGELLGQNHDTPPYLMSRNAHQGHWHLSGLPNYYLLTGDKRSKDVIDMVANWHSFMRPYLFKTPFAFGDTYREAERDYAWPFYVMNEFVRVTSDWTYHSTVCKEFVSYMIGWWKTPRNHIGYNPTTGVISTAVIGLNDYTAGTGWWSMTQMDNASGYPGANGTNPWMAGPLLGNLCKWYERELLFNSVGKSSGINLREFREMLYQCLNYVVKHGWVSGSNFFCYAETARYDAGTGARTMAYPLKYIEDLYAADLAAGQITNPSWYDTRPTWATIANTLLTQYQTVTLDSNPHGFYGYEQVYPLDFFKRMGAA